MSPHHDQDPSRGRLKVFLGYASGVGKSFRMFDEARRRRERGQDVVAGALQPEIPQEIQPSLSAIEIVPTLDVDSVPVIDAGLQRYLHAHGVEAGWRTHEHFLVYLTPGANVARMLTVASGNAARFHCDVLAVTVKQASLSTVERNALDEAIREARAAGA